jgi:hypothetical protein
VNSQSVRPSARWSGCSATVLRDLTLARLSDAGPDPRVDQSGAAIDHELGAAGLLCDAEPQQVDGSVAQGVSGGRVERGPVQPSRATYRARTKPAIFARPMKPDPWIDAVYGWN